MGRGQSFSLLVIVVGLGAAVWWMHSAEESIVVPHETKQTKIDVQEKIPTQENKIANAVIKREPAVVHKINELQNILESKNDNDPRLDTDFKVLNSEEKRAIQDKYLSYKPEKLNEKGTLVFLLGRNIHSKEDLNFISQVLNEPACLSMANCNEEGPKATGEAAHEASVDAVSLAYPQIVSIKSIERSLTGEPQDWALRPLALKSLEDASHSKTAVVAQMARNTLRKIAP